VPTQKCSNLSGVEAVKCIWEKYSALWIIPSFILGITIGFALGYAIPNRFNFIESMIPEIIGIGISITGIYYLEQWRQSKLEDSRLKDELLWQAKSQSNETAKSAVDRIRHKNWLVGIDGLLKGANLANANLMKADLSHANLERVNLHYADLGNAIFSCAILKDADLTAVNLEEADLRDANLEGTFLISANLMHARMYGTSFEMAFLSDANLEKAALIDANLKYTDLRRVRLQRASLLQSHLHGANLRGANLTRANLGGANLQGAGLINTNINKVSWEYHERDFNTVYVATLPDGELWTAETDMEKFTNPQHSEFQATLEKINAIRAEMGILPIQS